MWLNKKIIPIIIFLLISFNSFCQDSTWTKYIDQAGITAGIWFPEKNKVMGPQTLFGLSAGLKKKVHSLNLYADFIGLFSKMQDTLKISDNNIIINGKKIEGQQFTISYGYQFLSIGKITSRLEAGIGHCLLTVNPDEEKLQKKYNFLVSGINFKMDLTKNTTLGISIQYYFTKYTPQYKYPEINGNYLSARLIFGFR